MHPIAAVMTVAAVVLVPWHRVIPDAPHVSQQTGCRYVRAGAGYKAVLGAGGVHMGCKDGHRHP